MKEPEDQENDGDTDQQEMDQFAVDQNEDGQGDSRVKEENDCEEDEESKKLFRHYVNQ